MTLPTLYKGMTNSVTTTTTGGIGDSDTTIPVSDLSVFPYDAGLATLGTGQDAETILFTGRSASSGAGNLTGVTREYDKIGTRGAKKSWNSGTTIARRFTRLDHDSMVDMLTNTVVTKTGDYTTTGLEKVILCNAVSGGFTITLGTASPGEMHTIKKVDATGNLVTISAAAQIDGQATQVLKREDESVDVVFDGTTWNVI